MRRHAFQWRICCLAAIALVWTSHAFPQVARSEAELLALREQARALEHGEGVAKDVQKAAALYCDGARAGDIEALYSLGWMYANGRGMPRDDGIAAAFLQLAADKQHAPSQRMLRYISTPPADLPECMKVVSRDELDPATLKPLERLVFNLAPEYGISPVLALAIARTESNMNPVAVSPKNAQGLMQLIPETSVRFNVRKPFDAEQNIRGGLAYLRWLLAYFEGDVSLAAAGYNAGEGTVNRYRGIPPYPETRNYVKRITGLFGDKGHPFDAAITPPSPELAQIMKRHRSNKP